MTDTPTPRTDALITDHGTSSWVNLRDLARTLERELAAALAAREQDRKDAARYRWLRERADSQHGPFVGYRQHGCISQMTRDNADNLIDTAIAAQEAPDEQ